MIRGQDAIYTAGRRTPAPLAVEVRDETGTPVAGAAVSFRLPASGPGGLFLNGLARELVVTGPDGRAVAPTVNWNGVTGPFEIRVTAVKDQARAGIVVPQQISNATTLRTGPADVPEFYKPRRHWVRLTAIVGGAAAGAFATKYALARRTASAATAPAADTLRVGAPVITIGGPQ